MSRASGRLGVRRPYPVLDPGPRPLCEVTFPAAWVRSIATMLPKPSPYIRTWTGWARLVNQTDDVPRHVPKFAPGAPGANSTNRRHVT